MTRTAARESFVNVCHLLNDAGARYVVIGGFGCLAHGLVRATKDVDILIPKDLENAGRVQAALARLPLHLADEHEPAEFIARPLTILGDIPRMHVMTVARSLNFERAWQTRVERVVDGVPIPFAGLDALIESKETGRPQDLIDVAKLRALRRVEPQR